MNTESIRINESSIGFEFEFLRDPSYNIGEVKKKIKDLFKVDIKIEKDHHSEFIPTEDHWKIEPDYSGGKNLVELITGPLPYTRARVVLLNMLKLIRDDDKLSISSKCGLHINININGNYVKHVDILKYILKFDEDLVYKYFPDRDNNIYAKSIKSIYPRHPQFDLENLILNKTNYVYPSNKYYGINFTKLAKGYLEFRYIGGEHYADRADKVLELMDYFIDSLINCYNEPYDKEDINRLKTIVEKKWLLFIAMRDYFRFTNVFKNIKLLGDTSDNPEVIKCHFHKIIQVLFPLFQKMENIDYNMKGTINYDSDSSILEISGFNINDTVIDSQRVVIIETNLTGCVIENITLINSKTTSCDLNTVETDGCELIKTRVKEGYHSRSTIIDGYITGKFLVLDNCEVKGDSIFRDGTYISTDIDKSVEIIEAKEKKR